jgi:ABC-type Na+ efflux pump permease subunit
MKNKLLLVFFALIFTLSACAKSPTPTQAPPSPMQPRDSADYGKSMSNSASESLAPQAASSGAPAATERMVIRTASMKVSVADPAQAMQAVQALANTFGGYVVNSEVGNNSDSAGVIYTTSSITIRVPAEKLDEAMAKIRELAADAKTGVISESVSGQDVTSEYVDSESRLTNLKSAEKQLQALLDKATDLQYTVEIFRQLTEIRGQIEVLQGQMKYLKESAQLSAVSVWFVAEASLKPIEIGGWKPEGAARAALQALINAAQGLGTFLIWFAIAWLPFLIPLGLIAYFIIKAILKAKAKRRAEQQKAFYYAQPVQPYTGNQTSAPQEPEQK